MVAIKDINMPKSCDTCSFNREDSQSRDYCCINWADLRWVKSGKRDEDCPLIEVVEPKRGYWIDLNKDNKGYCDDNGNPYVKCSECGYNNGTDRSEYCPECGTKMDGEENDLQTIS